MIVGLLLRKDLQPPVLKTSADMFTLTCVFDAVRSTAVALTVSRYLPSSTVRDLHEAGRRISECFFDHCCHYLHRTNSSRPTYAAIFRN